MGRAIFSDSTCGFTDKGPADPVKPDLISVPYIIIYAYSGRMTENPQLVNFVRSVSAIKYEYNAVINSEAIVTIEF